MNVTNEMKINGEENQKERIQRIDGSRSFLRHLRATSCLAIRSFILFSFFCTVPVANRSKDVYIHSDAF